MGVEFLTPLDLSISAGLVILVGLLSWRMGLDLEKQLAIAACRMVVQLLFIGQILRVLFANVSLPFVLAISMIMLIVAGREVIARQQRKISGIHGWLLGIGSMFVSSFGVAFFGLTVVVGNDPWYGPQYAIPLLGMLLGNTMTVISISLERMSGEVWQQRQIIEQRLLLGQNSRQAITEIRQQAMRAGMIPVINSMAVAGLVSLPGMMTGQILGGTPPAEAVKYQIMIMFLICGGAGFGSMAAIGMLSRRIFDDRERLRLDVFVKK